jgi:hypothetical protein
MEFSMAKCTACQSDRVYRGYRRAPLLLRLIRIHEYLCENCNLQFRAFSILGPRTRKRKKHKKEETENQGFSVQYTAPKIITETVVRTIVNQPITIQSATTNTTSPMSPNPETPKSSSTIKAKWEMPAETLKEHEDKQKSKRSARSHQVCPHCGSSDTERRRRKLWEKVAFSFTVIRAYSCRICGSGFYARRKNQDAEKP